MADKKKSHQREEEEVIDDSTDEGRGGLLSEGLKKIFAVGVGAAFLTEESIRNYMQDLKLPKEMLGVLLQGAQKSKEQLMNRVGNEVITIIQKIDFVKEASRFVETHKFRVSAEIEVVKKDQQ